MTDVTTTATLHVAATKADIPNVLNDSIISIGKQAIQERGAFTIALSGGSLPSFLAELPTALSGNYKDVDPTDFFSKWHVILADERCVPLTDDESNMKSLNENLFDKLPSTMKVPTNQIHPINVAMLNDDDATTSTSNIAVDYESNVVKSVLDLSGGLLDVAVLGFGPDGHTCSLFPNHGLLNEMTKLVAPITDSPKPPPNRITLTFPVLNTMTRHVVFCGAGSSKQPIVDAVFDWKTTGGGKSDEKKTPDSTCVVIPLTNPPPFPCGMVRPNPTTGVESSSNPILTWVIDADALPATAKL